MKKILLVITLILTLIGCGINKNKLTKLISNKDTEEVSTIMIDRVMSSFPLKGINIISTQKLLDVTIFKLAKIKNKKQLSLIKALQDAHVDFEKDNILIYTFRQHSICDYRVDRFSKNTQKLNIVFTQTSEICGEAAVNYYLAYRLSKDIKKVSIKAFEKETVLIDM